MPEKLDAELRPVGTKFTVDYPPDLSSTDPMGQRVTWEVIAHRQCVDKNGHEFTGEEIRAITIKEIDAD